MKIIKLFLSGIFLSSLLAFFSTSFTGCVKQDVVHDTTLITLKDTITIKDTIVIKDTVRWDLRAGLVAYYNFNGGNLYDSSGNNNNIVFNNNASLTSDRFGNQNNAYAFDGIGNYMRVANSASINPSNITMFAIIRVDGFNQASCHGNQIFGKGSPDNVNGYYALRFLPLNNGVGATCAPTVDTTQEIFTGSFGDNIPQGAAAGAAGHPSGTNFYFVRPGEWYTIVYTYDGNISKFYVNGALVSSTSNTGTVTFTPNTQDLYIGSTGDLNLFPYYFKGAIDEVRIYNTAISAQQVGFLNLLKDKYVRLGSKLVY